MNARLNTKEIVRMCREGRAREARKLLLDLLATSSGRSKARQRQLLDGLLQVELCTGRTAAALQVLERRRSLGYRAVGQRMDAALHAATFLRQLDRLIDARAELIQILQDPGSLQWDGLLLALSSYIEIDKLCREEMNTVLVEGCKTVIGRFGIPLQFDGSAKTVSQTIREARRRYSSDSRAYSELVCRAMTERTPDGRKRLISEIQTFPNQDRVEFFNDQAKDLLNRLKSRN